LILEAIMGKGDTASAANPGFKNGVWIETMKPFFEQ